MCLWKNARWISFSFMYFFQAKPYLEKAMKLDPSNLEPVYVLTEILGQEKQYDKGIEM